MTGYEAISGAYDALTVNVDYDRRADYIDCAFQQNNIKGIVLDAGCGTGTLTLLLARRGYDMIGVDCSAAMLNQAYAKSMDSGLDVRWLNQDLTRLDLFGTVTGIVCMQDTINHIEGADKLREVFRRFALFTEPGGMLILDCNTPYKHSSVLADNAFVFETEQGLCVWRNEYQQARQRVGITIDLFERRENGLYSRGTDSFYEYTYAPAQLQELLNEQGYDVLSLCDGEEYGPVRPDTQRILICARKRS